MPAARHYLLLASLLAVSACAQLAPPKPAEPAAAAAATTSSDDKAEPPPANLPQLPLTNPLLFKLLIADIAEQRGQGNLSSEAYRQLAQETRDPRVARRAVESAVRAGQLNEASQSAKLWSELQPESELPRQMIVALLLRTQQWREVEPYLAEMIAKKPSEQGAIFAQLHRFWPQDADRQQVADLTSRLAAPYPDVAEASFAVALATLNANRNEQALAALERTIVLRPDWEGAILVKAQLLESKTPEAATAFLAQMNAAMPKSLEIRLAYARRLAGDKRYHEALPLFREVSKEAPHNLDARLGLGLSALQLHQYADAEQALKDALELKPRNTDVLRYYLGQIAEERWQMASARSWYEAVQGDEYRRQAQMRLARVQAKLGEKEAALQIARKLPAATPGEAIEKIQLQAQVLRESHDYPAARAVLEEGIAANPDNLDLIYDRSLVAELQGQLATTLADLERYLAARPDSVLALNALGYTLANRTDRLAESEQHISKALRLDPENPVIIDSLGWLRYRQGRVDEAKELLQKAYSKMNDPEIAAHYGELLWQTGQQQNARQVWEDGSKLDPQNEVLRETQRRLGGS